MLAAFMNLRAGLYYELLSCFMGKGDKETFAAALAAVNAPYAIVSTPLGSAGLRRTSCRHDCVVPATLLPWSATWHIPDSSRSSPRPSALPGSAARRAGTVVWCRRLCSHGRHLCPMLMCAAPCVCQSASAKQLHALVSDGLFLV